MANEIPDLWPDSIRVDILSPLAALRAQGELLKKKTKGVLSAELVVQEITRGQVHKLPRLEITMDLNAPAVRGSRITILTAVHYPNQPYPVVVKSSHLPFSPDKLLSELPRWFSSSSNEENSKRLALAATEEGFFAILKDVFQSPTLNIELQSLIARSNDETSERGGGKVEIIASGSGTFTEQDPEDELQSQ